ncbi:Gfo/Idh/MocA family protein [Cohnella sp. GCM10020058]|uniref:Gfo/Idh/MocA family protein n=1 Tax=Cohnella sp. GCM10020058 TaxID=3317330 RepID=UPI0036319524
MNGKVTVALIGAGLRGIYYASYAIDHPAEMQVVAVAEPNAARKHQIAQAHGIAPELRFDSADELLARPKLADAVLICTQDKQHYEQAMKALAAGYHVLLEKPMSPDAGECLRLGEAAASAGRIFSICHVLRYTDFFSTIKALLDEGRIGRLTNIVHNENVGYWHQAHSFVRGNWSRTADASPMILAKACHDLDILLWLAGTDCVHVSSFGSLGHFRPEHAPAGAPQRCLDGCPAADECLYYAPRQYLTDNTDWPTSAISDDPSYEARYRALLEGPYGRCVYRCDNDVVDRQVVNLEFSGGATAAFTMSAFTRDIGRSIKLMGTKGEIRGTMEEDAIEVLHFGTGKTERIAWGGSGGHVGHGGGDERLMQDFVRLVGEGGGSGGGRTSAEQSVQSHLMAFAAEKSRTEGIVVELAAFVKGLQG